MTAPLDQIREEFIARFPCSNIGCDNFGIIAVQIAEDELEPQQCQWCYEHRLPYLEYIEAKVSDAYELGLKEASSNCAHNTAYQLGQQDRDKEIWEGAKKKWHFVDKSFGEPVQAVFLSDLKALLNLKD